jgi:polyvinyl alcohol dehydrogenase (cytochrome)
MRRKLSGLAIAGAALLTLGLTATIASASETAPRAPASDWTQYTFNAAGSGDNTAETAITAANVHTLHAAWVVKGGKSVSMTPLVVGGVVYWGSWDGNLHATSLATHATLWTRALGFTTCGGCNPKVAGMASTPAYGTIGTTPVLWVSDGGNDKVGGGHVAAFAVNAKTGAIIWRTNIVAVGGDTFMWASVRAFGGSVYVATSSQADAPLIPGHVYKLNATTGAMQANVSTGGGVWGTPSIDSATGMMYVPVGSPTGGGTNFAFSLLEVRASNLSVVAHYTIPKSEQLSDGDFGSVPTLFDATIGGVRRHLVGLGNKNGLFYAWDRTNIAAGPLWKDQVAKGGNGPQGGGGTLSPAVWDGSTLYVAGGNTTIAGKSCPGGVRAINPATGAYKWQFCVTTGHVLGALAGAPGLIAVPAGSSIVVLSTSGKQLAAYKNPSGALYWGGPSIGDGHVFAPGMDGTVTALAP